MAATPDNDEEFEDSTIEINSPSVANDALISENDTARLVRGKAPMQVEDELEYYRNKAIHQDILIFEMRALLQSGKGFGNILNLKEPVSYTHLTLPTIYSV